MPLVKVKPDFARPARSGQGRHARAAQGRPVLAAYAQAVEDGRPQQPRHDHHAPQGRRPQAALPRDRFPARQGRHRRQRRAARVRPEPQRAPRPAALRRRRAPLHDRAEGRAGGHAGSCPAPRRRSRPAMRCRCATSRSAPIVHCVEMLPGKGAQLARSAGGHVQVLAREGSVRAAAAALGRDPQGAHRLPRHHRRGRQRRAQPRVDRQGGAASAGAACARRCAAWR